MRKLTKKLNNNTFVGSDVNGYQMRGGGFRERMRKAGRSMKSKIITGARGIRSGSRFVGKGFKWAGRSFKKKMSKVRQTLHKPFKNQSLAKKQSRVQKRTTNLEAKTGSYKTKINEIDRNSTKYQESIKTLEEMLKNNPNNPYAERRLRETSNKLKNLQKSRNQITAKLTTRKAELNTSKGKLNAYTTELENKARTRTNKAMSNYQKFHEKGKWAQRFQKFTTRSGRRSRAINKGLKGLEGKTLTPDQMILQYKNYKKEIGANPEAKMESQQNIRNILADRKAKQMSFTFGQRRRTKDLVEYLKNSKKPLHILEKATKATQQATNLIKNSKLQSQINKSYSEKARLLSKQSKNEKRLQALVNDSKSSRTGDEKRKMERAFNRTLTRKESREDLKNKFKTLFPQNKLTEYDNLKTKKVKTPEDNKRLEELSKERREAMLSAFNQIREENLDKKRKEDMEKTQAGI